MAKKKSKGVSPNTVIPGFILFCIFGLMMYSIVRWLPLIMPDPVKVTERKICYTKECNETAKYILEAINEDVDPCRDFHKFACAKPSNTTVEWQLEDPSENEIAEILQEASDDGDPQAYKDMRKLFKGCMNMLIDDKNYNESRPFGEYAYQNKRNPEGMSLLMNNWTAPGNISNFEKEYIMAYALQYPMPMLFALEFKPTKFLTEAFTEASFSPPPCDGINKAFLNVLDTDETFINTSRLFLDVAIKAQNRKSKSINVTTLNTMKEEINQLLNLQRNLSKLACQTRTDEPQSFKWTKFVQWAETNCNMLKYADLQSMKHANLDVKLHSESYFKDLNELFNKLTLEMRYDFYYFRYFMQFGPQINNMWLTAFSQNATFMELKLDEKSRKTYCANLVWDTEVYRPAIKRRFAEINDIKEVKESFSSLIDQIDWLTESKKQEAKKITCNSSALRTVQTKFNEYYDKFANLSTSKAEISKTLHLMNETNHFKNYDRIVGFKKWTDKYYDRQQMYQNAFKVDTKQSSIPHMKLEKLSNPEVVFATKPLMVATELTRSLADAQVQWGTAEISDSYTDMKKCFIDQYSKFMTSQRQKINPTYLNGSATLEENMADNGGLKLTYRMYKDNTAENGEGESLPIENKFTKEQLFFISYAQRLCAAETGREYSTPIQYRIMGALQNSKEFADAFQCRSYSNMFSPKRCDLWKGPV